MSARKMYKKSTIKKSISISYYWKTLIGTAHTWFIYDFVVSPNSIFSDTIISAAVAGTTGDTILKTAEWKLLLGTIALPGVFVGAWLCERIGRKWKIMISFRRWIAIGLIIGLVYDKMVKIFPLFVIFYGVLASFGNFGLINMLNLITQNHMPPMSEGEDLGREDEKFKQYLISMGWQSEFGVAEEVDDEDESSSNLENQ